MAPVRPRPPRQQPTRVRPPRDHRDALKRRALDLISKIGSKDRYAIFLEPVNLDAIPGYADVISRPMDLSTVRANVSVGVYRTPDDLRADLDLIWANCIKFNADGSIYYREAVRLRALAGKYFEEFLRNLARDGLPYGPRRSGASHHPTATPSAVSPTTSRQLDKPASAVSLKAAAQRLRYTARARRRSLNSLDPALAPRSGEPDSGNDPITFFDGVEQQKGQMYTGPYQRLRRFPNSPAAAAFPYVRGTMLQQRLQPFPPAWQALVGRKHVHQQQPNFMSAERDVEMQYALRYQDYVTRSAPTARRLLATIFDPFAVLEHDAAIANASNLTACPANNSSNETSRAEEHGAAVLRQVVRIEKSKAETEAEITISPKKRPRHGDLRGSYMHSSRPRKKADPASSSKRPAAQPPSPGAVQDLREILKAHKIDDSFLNSILKDSNPCTFDGDMLSSSATDLRRENTLGGDSSAPVNLQTKSPNSQKQSALSCAEAATPAAPETSGSKLASNTGCPTTHKNALAENGGFTHPSDAQDAQKELESGDEHCSDEESDGASDDCDSSDVSSCEETSGEEDDNEAEQQRKDADLNELLRMNHSTLLNIMRTKALKDVATGSAWKDLNAREQEYAAALQEGVALVASKVPPRLLIPQEKAAELALEAARQSTQRRDRKRKHAEMVAEKARAVAAAPVPVGAVPVGSLNAAVAVEYPAPAIAPPTVASKTAVAKTHVQPAGVPPAVRVKKLTPAGVVRSEPIASVIPNKTSE